MRLLELEIENYGLFNHRVLDFRGGGFQLVYGPNEAGKSTLLQLIRELLFGFPHQCPYAFHRTGGMLAATARVELADGTEIRFRREKRRGPAVQGSYEADGRPIDAAELQRLLGSATFDLYQHVFGFSLAELAKGQESLKSARLTEALYGGGLGGLHNFQSIQAAIAEQANQLYGARARKNRVIHDLLQRISEQKKALNAAVVNPDEYQQLEAEYRKAEQSQGALRQQLNDLRQQEARYRRIRDALPHWLEQVRAEEELKGLVVPPELPARADEEFQRLQHRRQEVETELRELEQERAAAVQRLESLELAPELVAEEAEIRRLHQHLAQVRANREKLVQQQPEAVAAADAARQWALQLDPQWQPEDLERYQVSLALRETIDQQKEQYEALEQRETELRGRTQGLELEVTRWQQRLDELSRSEAVPRLESPVGKAAAHQADRQRKLELEGEQQSVAIAIQGLRTRLAGPVDHPMDTAELLRLPLEATVQEFRQRLNAAREQLRAQQQRVDDAQDKVAAKEWQLQELELSEALPAREELLKTRARRDAGWQLIRQRYIRRKPVDDEVARWLTEPDEPLPDAYEREVRKADDLADQRQAKAELVARQEQLVRQIELDRQQLGQARQRLEERRQELLQVEQQWQAEWASCHFQPAAPEAMLDWLRLHGELLDKLEDQTRRSQQISDLADRIGDFEDELRDALPGLDLGVDLLLQEARRQVDRARDAAVERGTCERELAGRRLEGDQLQRDLDQLRAEQAAWRSGWHELLEQCGFPADWDARLAAKVAGVALQARTAREQAQRLQQYVKEMTDQTAQFESRAKTLCQQLAGDLVQLPAEDAVEHLNQRLLRAQQAAQDQAMLAAERSRLEARSEKETDRRDLLGLQIRQLLAAAGAETESQFHQVAARAARQAELQQQRDASSQHVRAICGTEDEDEFRRQLAGTDSDALQARLAELESELRITDEDYQQAVQSAALRHQRLDAMQAETGSLEAAQQLESSRSQLGEAIERWAPLVLAQGLLQRAISRFEHQHQPALLGDVQRLLDHMTQGRYVAVQRQLDDEGTLVVQQRDGQRKPPWQLSTGTREQLYLAIRLAYVQHYCREAEPLPLVMDDVLVNFDDQRAQRTLEVLLEIAESRQIIFLTCHQALVELVARRLPTLEPIQLDDTPRSAGLEQTTGSR